MSVRDKKIVIILAGVIVFALAYFFVYSPAANEKVELEAENQRLNTQYADLSEKASHAEEYRTSMEAMAAENAAIFEKFPSYLQIEDGIMDVIALERNTKSFVSNFTVSDPMSQVVTYQTDAQAPQTETAPVEGATDGTAEQPQTFSEPYQLYDVSTVMDFECDYAGMKQIISEVVGDSEKKTICTLNLSFDSSTGRLQSSMLFDSYFLYGLDKPYEGAPIPNINHGTTNVFGTPN